MAVFHNKKPKKNYYLRDPSISLKAKGLLSEMLTLPGSWDYSIAGFAKINKEGKDAIRAAVQELEAEGYIVRHQIKDANGKFYKNEYIVYETPHPVAQLSEKPASEMPLSENPTEKYIYIETNMQGDFNSLSDGEFQAAVITGINELAHEGWTADFKNDLFLGVMALYDPNRFGTNAHAVRSKSSVDATFEKLSQYSSHQEMMEALYAALKSGYQDVLVPCSGAVGSRENREGA